MDKESLDDFLNTCKLQVAHNVGDNASDLESEEDGDEFLDIDEEAFINEENWLTDSKSNCNGDGKPLGDLFKALYSELDEFTADISHNFRELLMLGNSSIEPKGTNNRNALIDSRTFTRPKKYLSGRPTPTSIIPNSGDDGRHGKLQRRLTTTISPTPSIINKLEDLNRINNRPLSAIYGERNWEDGSQEGMADFENSSIKTPRRTVPASIIDRLQELKRSNNSYVSSRTPEIGNHLNALNGNFNDFDMAEDAMKVKTALDFHINTSLTSSRASDIFRNIPDYPSYDDNESFISLDETGVLNNASNYSSMIREMEQDEMSFYSNSRTPPRDVPLSRLTFGGMEIPINNDAKIDLNSTQPLLKIDGQLNRTYEVVNDSASRGYDTFVMKKNTESPVADKYDVEKKSSLVDVIMQSDIIKNLTPNYNYKYCDNRNDNTSDGDRTANNSNDNLNETYTQNELNKRHSEKYTTKIFDSSFKKCSPSNGRKDSDHSEDDRMSTTSDNSHRSVDSNSELKNIEELKNIALQQNRKLTDVKISKPKLQSSRGVSYTRKSDEWRNLSPMRSDLMMDGESQGSSNSSSRAQSPRRSFVPAPAPTSTPATDVSRRSRPLMKQPPKVPQRELKLKPALVRPTETLKKPATRIPSGIPRPQIRVSKYTSNEGK